MKDYRIAVQIGLEEIRGYLISKGFRVLPHGKEELDADITVLTGLQEDEDDVTPTRMVFKDDHKKEKILIDATELSKEEVLQLIKLDWKLDKH